jgi:hypothetical protein
MGTEKFMDNRKAKGNNNIWQILLHQPFRQTSFRPHVPDYSSRNSISRKQEEYHEKMSKIIDFSKPQSRIVQPNEWQDLSTTTSSTSLLMSRTDIDVLSKELHFENPVDIFDWLRAILSNTVEKIHFRKD